MTGFEILGQIVAGWLFADFVGGLGHWWEDRAAEARWPIVGRWIVAPNRLHHTDPVAFTRAGFLTRNSTTWAAVVPISALVFLLTGPSPFWVAATIGGLMMNQVHFWAHRPPLGLPYIVRTLQTAGLFQSGGHHHGHHSIPSRRYCVLTNLLNPFLDRYGFWTVLERGLSAMGMPVNGGTR
ncbi:fatty acid desaturase CarF family protein [Sphingomonas sp. AOB5]|uniref:fatty acid desaturase CarF family protein n=1 Tax=Sphingomonas sp. AOB5 TaxID=3034017 RepID=UPI0023FA3D03|nr:fatty acid desaturase CarF family protein [Sphingomonas sp. AOB5]MDF7776871.1 fatty acid desaturase CarF family protein [Sphingomonas sp. AOB5]